MVHPTTKYYMVPRDACDMPAMVSTRLFVTIGTERIRRASIDIIKKTSISLGYWATSISTTVLSEKVLKTDLFPDLDIIFRILDMKRSRSPRGESRPRFPGDDTIFPKKKKFLSIFFFRFFSRYPGTGRCVPGFPEIVPGLREIFSDIDFFDYTIFEMVSPR